MFRGFARSTEAVFSRWAIKRICKFFLKKKLGEFILGDIDLEQLDVQLHRGTIQLADVALNVDCLNQKLVGAPVILKEGSIASLSIKVPWDLQNFYIELEELELVIAPYVENKSQNTSCLPTEDGERQADQETSQSCSSTMLDIHEGVKLVAKIVKWFLTSFHIKLKNLIVAFDPCLDRGENEKSLLRSLVLRIAELEYGTCVSEDINTCPESQLNSILGISKLTNFIKFHGAVVESLQMDDIDRRPHLHSNLGTSFSEWYAECLPSDCTSTILTGPGHGFSGKVNLSIPWKNGSLDIRQVDADISVDPVEVRVQLRTITWVIALWESLKSVGTSGKRHHYNASEYPSSNCRSPSFLSASKSMPASDLLTATMGNRNKLDYSDDYVDTVKDAMLPPTNLIHNWVSCVKQEDQAQLDEDYGASVDQFFECFDGMSSQENSGSSGLLHWTYSVFNAITFASTLASGSVNIPSDHCYSETNIQASIREISVIFSPQPDGSTHLNDVIFGTTHDYSPTSTVANLLLHAQSSESYMSCPSSINDQSTFLDSLDVDLDLHHIEARCQHVVLNFQKTTHQNMKIEAAVGHVVVHEFYDSRSATGAIDFYHDRSCGYGFLSETLQKQVQGTLPSFPRCHSSKDSSNGASSCMKNGLVKVKLLESYGGFSFRCEVRSIDFGGTLISSTSFSLNFPNFIVWVDFQLVNMLLNVFKEVQGSLRSCNLSSDSSMPSALDSNRDRDDGIDAKKSRNDICQRASVQGTIEFANSRIILCFPSKNLGRSRHSSPLDTFIAIELLPSVCLDGVPNSRTVQQTSQSKGGSSTSATSLHIFIGGIESFLVTSNKSYFEKDEFILKLQSFSARKLLSVTNRVDGISGITMLWQEGPVTVPWMASRTWSLATVHDHRTKKKMAGKSGEFSSATTVEDLVETNSQVRQELILSSAFFLHVRISQIWIDIESDDCKVLMDLFSHVESVLLSDSRDNSNDTTCRDCSPNYSLSFQTSILVECNEVDIHISLNDVLETSSSVQKELQGVWNFLRLRINKFELLTVSNIGGTAGFNFFWLNHGEGELWGSIIGSCENSSVSTRDFLLFACKNSNSGRGNGEGTNPLSLGSASTDLTHICNPKSLQSFTSVVVRCGTIIAPGGRLDWINAIVLLFSSSSIVNEPSGQGGRSPKDNVAYKKSVFLELVDIALSYEPHVRNGAVDCVRRVADAVGSRELTGQYVSCLFAAASLDLSNYSTEGPSSNEYTFQLQDLGLLICEYSDLKCKQRKHDVHHLRESGYIKVAYETFVLALVHVQGSNWVVEFMDSQINLETCHDTFHGLLHFISQLVLIYAPNMDDAMVHLQSRWNAIQQASTEEIDAADTFDNCSARSSDEINNSVVLLGEIFEHTFGMSEECDLIDYSDSKSQLPLGRCFSGFGSCESVDSNSSTNFVSLRMPFEGSDCKRETIPHIIDGFYLSNSIPPSKLSSGDTALQPDKDNQFLCHSNIRNKRTESGKCGWYDSVPMIVENHVTEVVDQRSSEHRQLDDKCVSIDPISVDICTAKVRFTIKNFSIKWRMYAGLDWPKSMGNLIPQSNPSGRDCDVFLEFSLSGINLQYDMYPVEDTCASKLSVSVEDFHLYDCSRDAPWRKMLGYYHSKDHPRQSIAKAFKLDLEAVKPDPSIPLEEYRLLVELLPMRLHLDQSQLNFLVSYFGNDLDVQEPCSLSIDNISATSGSKHSSARETVVEEALLPFFKKCDVKPLLIRVDYIPRHIDLSSLRGGNYAELLNLVPWKGIELQLKHVSAVELYGWSNIFETVFGEWLEDISRNQVHKLLKGLPPLRSLIAVSSGASKLVSLPIRSYKKDQKLLKGMQRGAIAFTRSISLEAVTLGVHLAAGLNEVLFQTECILSAIPPSVSQSNRGRRKAPIKSNQPKDARQGIRQACDSLGDGLVRSASALVGTPLKAYKRGEGAGSALATAIRGVPAAVMAPVSASARAVHYALLGARNSLDPEHKRESMEKYSGHSGS